MSVYTVLHELKRQGSATSTGIADALGWSVKKTSTYLSRLHDYGMIRRTGKQSNGFSRPSIIWGAK